MHPGEGFGGRNHSLLLKAKAMSLTADIVCQLGLFISLFIY